MPRGRTVLGYASPETNRVSARAGLRRFVTHGLRRVGRCFLLLVVLYAALHAFPEGYWYVGRRPQWVIWIDAQDGLTIGPSYDPWKFGIVPVIVGQLLLVSLPPWLVYRYVWNPRGGARRRPDSSDVTSG